MFNFLRIIKINLYQSMYAKFYILQARKYLYPPSFVLIFSMFINFQYHIFNYNCSFPGPTIQTWRGPHRPYTLESFTAPRSDTIGGPTTSHATWRWREAEGGGREHSHETTGLQDTVTLNRVHLKPHASTRPLVSRTRWYKVTSS